MDRKNSQTAVIVASFCSIRPYTALGRALEQNGWKVIIASTVENETAILHQAQGKIGFAPLLGSLQHALHSTISLRAIDRGGSAALIDMHAQAVAKSIATNSQLVWETAAGSLADVIISAPHSVPECLAAGQKLNIPVIVAAAYPFDAHFETSGSNHLIHSARAVEWAAVSTSINKFRASLGLRPQDQEESSFLPFIAGYSPLFSPLPRPPPAAPHAVSGFWRMPPENYVGVPNELDAFLSAGSPPVYVGFAGSPLLNPQLPYTAVARALAKLNLRGLFAAPFGVTLPAFGDHVFVVSARLPLEWAMARSSIAMHHGGPSSLAASLSAGIPTIVCPHLPQSYYAAQRVAVLGVGAVNYVPLQQLTEAAAEKLLQEASQPRAKELAREFGTRLQAEDGLPSAVAFIKSQVETHKLPTRVRMNWQPDEEAPTCTACHTPFTLFNRRSHCRCCGFVFCSKCLTHQQILNYRLPQLQCKTCTTARTRKPSAAAPKQQQQQQQPAPAKPPAAEVPPPVVAAPVVVEAAAAPPAAPSPAAVEVSPSQEKKD